MATPEIDPQQFRKRVQRIRDAWTWSLDAIVLVTGKGQDGIGNEDANFKATAMHLWLFGLEFTETVLGILKSGKLVLVTSQKKIKYLRDLEGPEVVLIPRTSSTELDDTQLQAFGSALRGENPQVTVGTLLTATPSGPLAKCLAQALPTLQGITVTECGGELAALLAPKDEEELALTRKSAFCSQHLLKQVVIARLEEIVDCDLVRTNKQVHDELMGTMENEDEMEKRLQSDEIDVGEVEVVFLSVQSGTNFEIKPDAGASQEKVPMQGTYLLSLGMKYHCYTSCVARTLIIDPTPAQRAAYDVVVSVHQLVVERLRPGTMFKDVYLAARKRVHEELPALEDSFVKNVGFLTGLGLKDPLYILDEGNERKVQPGMVFCVSVGFTEVGKWSAWLADTAIVPLQDGPCEVPTSLCTNSPMEVMFNLGDDPVEDPPPPPQPQRPPAERPPATDPKSKASSAARPEPPAKAKAQPAGPAKAAAPLVARAPSWRLRSSWTGLGPMTSNTIEITGGYSATTTRMVLKREMERFGPVDVCHMGNRDNPVEEPPWVRFADSSSCDKALAAIKAGEVVVDGVSLNASRSNRRGPPLVSREPRDSEVGSRELFLQRSSKGGPTGGGGGGRNNRRSRSRSRGRGGRRSRSRGGGGRGRRSSRSRSRGRRGHSPSSSSRSRDRRR